MEKILVTFLMLSLLAITVLTTVLCMNAYNNRKYGLNSTNDASNQFQYVVFFFFKLFVRLSIVF